MTGALFPRALLVMTSVLLLCSAPARAELHIGTALIPAGPAWDFSDSVWVLPPNLGDLSWAIVLATGSAAEQPVKFPEYWWAHYPALIAFAPIDSTYEELTSAPSDTTQYGGVRALFSGGVYVVRTQEFHYAKLRVLGMTGGVMIEYTYQDDGTRRLGGPVPTRAITWGFIKSLYRSP